jgi:hypothetical protein
VSIDLLAVLVLGLTAAVVVGMVCVALYLVPRSSLLGAVMLTGYLGGAVATHVRVGGPLLSHCSRFTSP